MCQGKNETYDHLKECKKVTEEDKKVEDLINRDRRGKKEMMEIGEGR